MSDKLPPNSPNAERAVLGSILRDNLVAADVAQIIRADMFYADVNRKVYAAANDLCELGKPADTVTVFEELIRRGQVADLGSPAYLAELWDAAPTAAHAEHYAWIVRDLALARAIGHAATEIQQAAERPETSVDGEAHKQRCGDELLEFAEKTIFAVGELGAMGSAQTLKNSMEEAQNTYDRVTTSDGNGSIPTGLVDIDSIIGGFRTSELTIIAARPSVGKTAFAITLAHAAATKGFPTLFFSLEQTRVDLAARLMCMRAGVDSRSFQRGKISDENIARITSAKDQLDPLQIHIDDSPHQTISRIASQARRLKHRQGIRMVVIDYLQLVQSERQRGQNREQEVSTMSRRLKVMARELDLPVLCLAQLNRQVENREGEKPRLSDLRESGAIEQDADNVLMLWRPDGKEGGTVGVYVAKQRNGPVCSATLTFIAHCMRFENHCVETGKSYQNWSK